MSEGLAFWTDDGTPGIQVYLSFCVKNQELTAQAEHWDPLPAGQNRDSVRITSHALYSGGLFLIDLELMPWGCGIWPACEFQAALAPSVSRPMCGSTGGEGEDES